MSKEDLQRARKPQAPKVYVKDIKKDLQAIGLLIPQIIFFVFSILSIIFIYFFLPLWLRRIPFFFAVLLIPQMGLALYWFRTRLRTLYGIVELLVGFITILVVLAPTDFVLSNITSLNMFQILGGLYIIVRGIDNINQGLPEELRYS